MEDKEFNSTNDEDQIYAYDDNAQTIGVSFDLTMLDNGFTPYLAYEMHSGDFEDPEKAGEAKSRSESVIRLGVLGSF